MIRWLTLICMIGWASTALASSADGVSAPSVIPPTLQPLLEEHPDRIVAVGFGYQHGGTSSIRIRTYDVESGDLLSEDQFDLNVVGGDPKDGESAGDRVFAGAVVLSAEGLSNFPMRVYDALTGEFLWQGQMNFVDVSSDDPRRRVRRASPLQHAKPMARLVSTSTAVPIASTYLVQAVDPESGQPIWQQIFRSPKPVAESITGENHPSKTAPAHGTARDYEIVVRFFEVESGKLVWSDRLSTRDQPEETIVEESPDHAAPIPPWHPRESNRERWTWWGVERDWNELAS